MLSRADLVAVITPSKKDWPNTNEGYPSNRKKLQASPNKRLTMKEKVKKLMQKADKELRDEKYQIDRRAMHFSEDYFTFELDYTEYAHLAPQIALNSQAVRARFAITREFPIYSSDH